MAMFTYFLNQKIYLDCPFHNLCCDFMCRNFPRGDFPQTHLKIWIYFILYFFSSLSPAVYLLADASAAFGLFGFANGVLFALKERNYGLCLSLNVGNFLYSSHPTNITHLLGCVCASFGSDSLWSAIRALQSEYINKSFLRSFLLLYRKSSDNWKYVWVSPLMFEE